MFEELITELDMIGVAYTEDYDTGTLTIDIADIDKTQLIELIVLVNGYSMPFDITDTAITVTSLETPEEPVEGSEPTEDGTDYADEALNSLGMF